MTNEEAIKLLKTVSIREAEPEDYTALDMAIQALEQQQKKPEKVKPVARIEKDEWYGTERIRYYCPKCGERISEKQQACEKCLIFFDWREKAYIKTIQTLEWGERP